MTQQPGSPDEALLKQIEDHATCIAREAGAILASHFGSSLDVQYKDEKKTDPVTNADKESQEYLEKAIAKRFPEHGILGEEQDGDDAEKERAGKEPAKDIVWVLDPLDGTKNFLAGLPLFACSIGVMHLGVPIAGAVYLPWPAEGGGVVLHARKGGGAFSDDKLMSVVESDEPKGNGMVTLPGGFRMMFRFKKPMGGKVGDVRMTGSIAYELAMVARGVTQFTVTTAPKLWDVAGGVLLVQEAGGIVMRGHRTRRALGLLPGIRWEPLEALVADWQSGKTTMKQLRDWSAITVLGNPNIVRYVTSNTGTRPMLRWRLRRAIRKVWGGKWIRRRRISSLQLL